ncbi:ribosomal protein L36 [Arthrobacter globiformis]|nr:ribosomal protein L36 [Arthrobacter globiformis]
MKVRNSLRALKKIPGAQIVRRRGRTFVINKKTPRMKARPNRARLRVADFHHEHRAMVAQPQSRHAGMAD